jgi:hypothetical protein
MPTFSSSPSLSPTSTSQPNELPSSYPSLLPTISTALPSTHRAKNPQNLSRAFSETGSSSGVTTTNGRMAIANGVFLCVLVVVLFFDPSFLI